MDERILKEIDAQLRLGFESNYDVLEGVRKRYLGEPGYPGDDDVDTAFVDRLVELQSEQDQWARPTDAERLDRAFVQLGAENILARHCYAPTRADAEAKLRSEAASARGYIFYTRADAPSLLDGTLDLAWGVTGTTDADELAGRIVSALVEAGLTVQWSGELDAPIQLRNLDWKHPRDPDSGETMFVAKQTPRVHQAQTADGKWRFRIVFLSNANDPGAYANVWHIHDRTAPSARGASQLGAFSPAETYSFEFTPIGLEIDGRAVQFELLAPPSATLLLSDRDDAAKIADAIVVVPRHENLLDMTLGRLEVFGDELPPTMIQLDPAQWSPEEIERITARVPYRVLTADLESGNGVLDTLKEVAMLLVKNLRASLESN